MNKRIQKKGLAAAKSPIVDYCIENWNPLFREITKWHSTISFIMQNKI